MRSQDVRTIWHALQVPVDIAGVVIGMSVAYLVRVNFDTVFSITLKQGYIPDFHQYVNQVFIMSLVLVLVFTFQGLYNTKFRRKFFKEIPYILWSMIFFSMCIFSYFFLTRSFYFSRFVLVFGLLFSFLAIVFLRAGLRGVTRAMLKKEVGKTRLMIIGENGIAKKITDILKKNRYYNILGTFMFKEQLQIEDQDGSKSPFESYIQDNDVEEIIFSNRIENLKDIEEILYLCRIHRISFRFVPDVVQIHSKNIAAEYIGDFPVMELKETRLDGWGKIFKRLFDLFCSLILLIILLIPFLIIGIIIKINSKGQVFVYLTRVSRNTEFKLIKFRSMVHNAHEMKEELLKYNERGDGPLFKMENDPRVTSVGRILRKTRIDELPQLINVLRGQMSLVGPRPHEPNEVAKYKRWHKKVLTIKPGMTGLAQVQGASDLSFDDEVRFDTYYIENWSFWFDIEILLRTVWVVFTGKGAC